jgi:hypothetical protein
LQPVGPGWSTQHAGSVPVAVAGRLLIERVQPGKAYQDVVFFLSTRLAFAHDLVFLYLALGYDVQFAGGFQPENGTQVTVLRHVGR